MKKSNLDHIKATGFKAPDAYFEEFDQRLSEKLEVQKAMMSVEDPGFVVPEGYFGNLDQKIQEQLQGKNPKVRTVTLWRHPAIISSIAACLLLMLAVLGKSADTLSIQQIETASIEEYLNNENLNTYDIASFLNEDDLELNDFVQLKISEESLENYLLNNASIEDLINEK